MCSTFSADEEEDVSNQIRVKGSVCRAKICFLWVEGEGSSEAREERRIFLKGG